MAWAGITARRWRLVPIGPLQLWFIQGLEVAANLLPLRFEFPEALFLFPLRGCFFTAFEEGFAGSGGSVCAELLPAAGSG
jgi:hypothetical protein